MADKTVMVRVSKFEIQQLKERFPQLAQEKNTTIVRMALIMLHNESLSDDFFKRWKQKVIEVK
jgi:hypothetical protein